MFEGKHIHFSPTDNKPLCSFSGKLCRQRRLNGYAFCIRHILEDKSAPFKQCSYVTRNASQKCLNAIPTSQDRGYCHSHMQVAGIIPKTERKSKAAPKADAVNNSSSSSSASPPSSKKDPSSVFKFEEESSDICDGVFSYKNGALHSKSKSLKPAAPQKDNKSSGKAFTTKKLTDKNKNVYTAIIPTGGKAKSHSGGGKSKSSVWSSISDASPPPPPPPLPISSPTQKSFALGPENTLKSLQADESRQFEQLKTLKQLDSSLAAAAPPSSKSPGFPRLSIPSTDESAPPPLSCEIPPPVITRSKNSIIIKTDSSSSSGSDSCSSSPAPNPRQSMKNRHEFLAHVRMSFKSQYKSIRKACKFSQDCEQSGKIKLRESLLKCVRIDASVCAQVLIGCGIKLPSLEKKASSGSGGTDGGDYDLLDSEGEGIKRASHAQKRGKKADERKLATNKRKVKREDGGRDEGKSPEGQSKRNKVERKGAGISEEMKEGTSRKGDEGDAHNIDDILGKSGRDGCNRGLETVLNSVGSSENAATPDGVITDASFDSTFEHSTSSQPDCEFSEDDLENSFELQMDPEIESQASRLLEDNVLTEADFTELFPDNPKFGRSSSDLQELGMTGLEFDVNDIDYSLFANIFPNFPPRSTQPESISISNQF